MTLVSNKKWLKLLSAAAAFSFFTTLALPTVATADTRPYFKAYGGDVFAGGWFNSQSSSCIPKDSAGSHYQSPHYINSTQLSSDYMGGILGYSAYSGGNAKGSSSQYGALALGAIGGQTNQVAGTEPYGFYTGAGAGSFNPLSFANSTAFSGPAGENYWGGFLEGGASQGHCITDYFGTKQNNPQGGSGNIGDVATLGSGRYLYDTSGGVMNIGGGTAVQKSQNLSIFVKGNVHITSNITYDSRANYAATTVPKFALVVLGSIYVDQNVSQLDGLYIAQPDPNTAAVETSDTGVIWTCHDQNPVTPPAAYINGPCGTKQLVVNGAFIAKQIILLRTQGDVATGATTGEALAGVKAAEVFHYTPEMVIGGGFFNPSTTTYKIESQISLPPVF